ncbi:MAG TPA: efflux RND transporter periplasmic adaptor subunit [Thiotrichales bacterium]|nr:efflux RND transporter periplasmic adaptor subunit [Thiotrichales bacterium]
MKTRLHFRWLFLLPLALGILLFALLKGRPVEPQREPPGETPVPVRVVAATPLTVVPRSRENGTVRPARVWNGVARVAGNVLELHPRLDQGVIIPAGEPLIRIDPADYELAVAQAESQLAGVRAQLEELTAREANTRATLEIEERSLTLAREEEARKAELLKKGMIPRSDYDRELKTLLTQRARVRNLVNTLNLLPAERLRLEAESRRLEAAVAKARLDLERTTLLMPFTGRISKKAVEVAQYVRPGEVLVSADGIDLAEIEVRLPLSRLRNLVQGRVLERVSPEQTADVGRLLGLSAVVMLPDDAGVSWPARVARIGDALDPRTRTMSLVLEVDHPYAHVVPGIRPPLVKGLFVTVELSGEPHPETLVVPEEALHQDHLYLVGPRGRLQRRQVETGLRGEGWVAVTGGLDAGEQVVITDLAPAIEGTLLEPVADDRALQRLVAAAGGRR